jgi:uncharacterized membrane protein YjfL (UPF0719 family)
MPWYYSLGYAAAFGGLGIVMAILGFKLFDLVETKIEFSEELRKGNLAVAIVSGSFIIGICIIIGRAIGS